MVSIKNEKTPEKNEISAKIKGLKTKLLELLEDNNCTIMDLTDLGMTLPDMRLRMKISKKYKPITTSVLLTAWKNINESQDHVGKDTSSYEFMMSELKMEVERLITKFDKSCDVVLKGSVADKIGKDVSTIEDTIGPPIRGQSDALLLWDLKCKLKDINAELKKRMSPIQVKQKEIEDDVQRFLQTCPGHSTKLSTKGGEVIYIRRKVNKPKSTKITLKTFSNVMDTPIRTLIKEKYKEDQVKDVFSNAFVADTPQETQKIAIEPGSM